MIDISFDFKFDSFAMTGSVVNHKYILKIFQKLGLTDFAVLGRGFNFAFYSVSSSMKNACILLAAPLPASA